MRPTTGLLHSTHVDRLLSGPDRDLVLYDQPQGTARLASLTDVHLWAPPGEPVERLPEVVAAMTSLRSLRIGPGSVLPSVVTGLRQGDLPESLEHLSVSTGDRALVWPDVVVPHLTTLYVGGPFRFRTGQFPSLRNLSLYPQRSLNNVRVALELPLEELNLLNVPVDEEVFRLLEPAGLLRLGLLGGRTLTSLTGISALPRLESLRLKNLTSLGDVSELATLSRLERLNIQYCTKITGITAINELDALRRLTIVGCGDIGLPAIEQKMSALEQGSAAATT